MNPRPLPTICLTPDCGRQVRTGKFRCSAHNDSLLEGLTATANLVGDQARRTYVGRTSSPERRLLEHFVDTNGERDHLLVLHWSCHRPEIEYLEPELIERCFRDKAENKTDGPDGNWWGDWNCLYLSFGWKNAARQPAFALRTVVTGLDGPRVAPTVVDCPMAPNLLIASTKGGLAGAIAIVGTEADRKRFYTRGRRKDIQSADRKQT